MSDYLRGVPAEVKSVESAALHVHCLAHSLNLFFACCMCTTVRDGLDGTS